MYCKKAMPMVVTGNFNIDMLLGENAEFAEFMKKYLALTLASDPAQSTNIDGTCVDLTFTKNIRLTSKRYYFPFLCHRPILSIIGC